MSLWRQLAERADTTPDLKSLFAADPARFTAFSARFGDMLLDFSKTRITTPSLALLLQLADQAGVAGRRDAMFRGDKINNTENRAVLHTALRAPRGASVLVDGVNVVPAIHETLGRLFEYADGIRSGSVAAADGKPFTELVVFDKQ